VEWEAWSAQSPTTASRLEKLRLIDHLARAFRNAGARPGRAPEPSPSDPSQTAEIVLWGLLRILEKLGEGGLARSTAPTTCCSTVPWP
jgi:hypothetical protein